MESLKFSKKVYVQEAGDEAPAKSIVLSGLSVKDLLTLHNEAAKKIGDPERKTFSNKTAAVEQTWAMLIETGKTKAERKEQRGETAPKSGGGGGGGGRGRTVKFEFPYTGQIKAAKEGSVQEKLITALLKGATDAECIKIVEGVEKAGTLTMAHAKTWRVLHSMHKSLGYGMRMDGEKIFVHTNK